MALVPAGGYGERVITPAASAARVPPGIDLDDAAAALVSGLTAISALEHHARLRRGERLLVQAAAGATGSACVQLGVHAGAVVFGTASPHKHEALRRLGVTHAIDYRARDFADAVRELTGGEGVDVIVDSLSGDAITRGLDILRPGGRFVEIGAAGVVAVPPVDPRRLFAADQSFIACNVARLDRDPERLRGLYARLVELLTEGVLRPLIHARLPRARADEAHELLRTRANVGKVLLIG
jgi:myxalamid-type polyketide synthase MxaE and MxaD